MLESIKTFAHVIAVGPIKALKATCQRGHCAAVVAAVVGVALSAAFGWKYYGEQRALFEIRGARTLQGYADRAQDEIGRLMLVLRGVGTAVADLEAGRDIDLAQLIGSLDPTNVLLEGIGWAPRIEDPSLDGVAAAMPPQDRGIGSFRDLLPGGHVAPMTPRTHYFPVTRVLSPRFERDLLGLDPISFSTADAGAGIELSVLPNPGVFDSTEQRIVVAIPVRLPSGNKNAAPHLRGYVVGLLNVSWLLELTLFGWPDMGLDFEAADLDIVVFPATSAEGEEPPLHSRRAKPSHWLDWGEWSRDLGGIPRWRTNVKAVDRIWSVVATPQKGALLRQVYAPALVIFLVGLSLTALVAVVFRQASVRRRILERFNHELRLREAALTRQDAILNAVFRDVPDAMVVSDPSRRIVMCNPGVTAVFGYASGELDGRSACVLYADPGEFDRLGATRFNPDATAAEEPYLADYRRKDGTVFVGETIGTPIRDDTGCTLGYLGVFRDVTERQRLQDELTENREFLRVMLDSIEDGIVACDADGTLKLFNRATEGIHGLPLTRLPPEAWADHYDLLQADGVTPLTKAEIPLFRALAGETVRGAEMVIRPKGGKPRYVRASGHAMYDDRGRKLGAVVSMHDVTERRAAEDAREVAEMALRRSQRMEAVGQLTGGIAHDFNNLLGIQMGNLEFLKDKVKGDAAATKWATNALRATERGAQLTRRLLGFSRQEARPGTPTDVNEVLADLEDILAKSLTSEIAVEIYPGDGLWPAEIDPGDLSDAVLNLALNARDAMPKGGRLVIETVNRAVGTEQLEREPEMTAGDYVLVSVSDTGTGMTAEVLERVFDPFFTTKAESGGTGLGMSMVYGFAKRSRGHVRIYSEAGHGTTVRLFLPRAQTEAETAAVATQKTLPRGTETVLVVDDEPDLLDIAGTMLRELGYRTAAARNGREASAILEGSAGKDIDLVFSDVIMPGGMNGFDLAARARETRPGVRVLLASGFTGHVTDKSADRTLVDAMLHKPYDKAQLAHAVRKAVEAGTEMNSRDGSLG